MKLPQGIETNTGNGKTRILKFLKNLYGQKQVGQIYNKYLGNKILTIVL